MAALLLLFSASLCLSYAAPTPATNNIMPKFVFSKGEDGKLLPVDARLVTIFNRIYSNGTMVEEKKVTELGVNQVGTEAGNSAHCPPGFVEGPEACYWFSRDKQPYLLAEHVCTTKGGRLAMVKTKQVHTFLGRYIHRTTKASHWIGLTDLLKERHFHWSDGTPLQPGDYMPWWRRQPDNSRRREHCVELKKVARYKWNDMPCTGLLHYVCERDN